MKVLSKVIVSMFIAFTTPSKNRGCIKSYSASVDMLNKKGTYKLGRVGFFSSNSDGQYTIINISIK